MIRMGSAVFARGAASIAGVWDLPLRRNSSAAVGAIAGALILSALFAGVGAASTETCADGIARTAAALDALQSGSGATAGHQSTAAQLHRQPTPRSLKRARQRSAADQQHDREALQRARAANAAGDETACQKALSAARKGLSRR